MKKSVKWVLVLLVVCGVGYYWRGNKSDMPEFMTHKLARGNITEKVTATGIINPISTINVGTQVSGTIKEIYVDYNSEVKKNQMLALIDPDLFEAKVAQQRAALDIAKAQVLLQESTVKYNEKNLQRIRKLHNQKYSADKELDLAEKDYDTSVAQLALNKAQVEQAEASLQSAETELRYTKIISPVDGIVVSKAVEVGQTVAASFQTPTLFNVAEDLTKMQIEASVVEADIAKVKEGQVVEFSVDSFPDEIFYGMVTQVRNEAITTSNVVTYEVIIEIDNRDLRLKPGMTANVEVITAQKENVLLVPNKALRFTYDDGTSLTKKRYKDKGLWILENGKPVRVSITTGVYDDDFTEVTNANLDEGEEIILEEKDSTAARARAMRMRMPR